MNILEDDGEKDLAPQANSDVFLSPSLVDKD